MVVRMTVKTSSSFDLDTFRRGYEEWDVDALLGLYADDVELIQIDRDNPPSSPKTRHGSDVLRGMLEHCAAAGVNLVLAARSTDRLADLGRALTLSHKIEHRVVTVTCEFPGGRRVMANSIMEIEDGRIVRELDVLSGDPK